MKTSAIKRVALSAALSVAMVASVHSAAYRHREATEKADGYEATNYQLSQRSSANEEYDSPLIETFISRVVDDEVDHIDFVYNELYSQYNEEYGYVVDFSYGSDCGFVIVSVVDDSEKIIEIDTKNSSPYLGKEGKYIYISFDNYFIEHDNGNIVKVAINGEEVIVERPSTSRPLKSKDKKWIASPQSYSYCTGTFYEKEIKNFYYRFSTELCPDKSNNCANAAGLIALNYWNIYHRNMLLKLNSSEMFLNSYIMNDSTAIKYMNIFYDYMNTNWLLNLWGGTTPPNCYYGFMRLITEKGYDAKKSEVTSFEGIKYEIDRGIPVFITSDDYYFTDCIDSLPKLSSAQGNHAFTINFNRTQGIENSHTFIGFGYAEYTLYDYNGKMSKVELVKIADGWGETRYFNYNISDTTNFGMAGICVVARC